MPGKWWPPLLKAMLVIAIIYFIGYSLPLKAADLAAYLKHADYRFYSSMALFALFLMLQAGIWVLIVNAAGAAMGSGVKLSWLTGLRIFIDSQFAKYIPGGVWNYAGRVVLATREGMPLAAQFAAILYENVLLVAAALAYALVLAVNMHVEPVPLVLVSLMAAGLAYLFYGRITDSVRRVFVKASHWKPLGRLLAKFAGSSALAGDSGATLTRHQFFRYLACFLCSHFVMGIAFWLLLSSFGQGHIGLFYAAGTFATSWLLGLLSPLPGGLGVREGFLVYFISLKLGTDAALQVSVIARLWNIMAEVTFWFVIQSISRLTRKVRSYGS
ncbi:lysylphosphatidylglycerol synthase domain-containing protein [Paenibacillus protaetiae]|uniref:Phosphatidylglycerol lysyltransferase n=1 Tax=Paenibacillus protaetiae TaxID=2509456 RepID=A0A4P6F664_9BACL|nr:lysylphosphatidylglycerol synthase domain-containing protein [Paenibacillus protaetiae]QAY65888.1 hypothetical protein ET464_05310 [Paenibacillus protaetiae]